jgi:hypothetical protein
MGPRLGKGKGDANLFHVCGFVNSNGFLGRPRGCSVDFNPSIAAICVFQVSVP